MRGTNNEHSKIVIYRRIFTFTEREEGRRGEGHVRLVVFITLRFSSYRRHRMEKERTDFFRVAVNIAEGGIPCKRRRETIVRMRDFPIERACNMWHRNVIEKLSRYRLVVNYYPIRDYDIDTFLLSYLSIVYPIYIYLKIFTVASSGTNWFLLLISNVRDVFYSASIANLTWLKSCHVTYLRAIQPEKELNKLTEKVKLVKNFDWNYLLKCLNNSYYDWFVFPITICHYLQLLLFISNGKLSR